MRRRLILLALALVMFAAGGFGLVHAQADELRIGWAEGATFDSVMGSLVNENAVNYQVYAALVRHKVGTMEIEPDLAESWTVSDDGLEYTFYLRRGVQWHRGYGEVTADDVVGHFRRVPIRPPCHLTEPLWPASKKCGRRTSTPSAFD